MFNGISSPSFSHLVSTFVLFLFCSVISAQISTLKITHNSDQLSKFNNETVQSKNALHILSEEMVIPFEENHPFTAVGIRIDYNGYDDIKVSIRTASKSNYFSNWIEILMDDDIESYEYNFLGQLYFAEAEAERVQYKIETNTPVEINEVSVMLINPGETTQQQKSVIESKRSLIKNNLTDDFELPPVVSRTEWGCPDEQSSRWSPNYTNVTHLIVHHSATSNTSNDWAGVVRTFWEWHTINNGWGDIGYNFLVDPTGVVYEGRSGGNNAIGAHFCGTNGGTMGTCMIGTYTNTAPTNAAVQSLVKILAWKCNLDAIDPLSSSYHGASSRNLNHISGHRNGCATECPGTTLYNSLSTIRTEVASLLASTAPMVVTPEINSFYENQLAYKPVEITFSSSMDQSSVESALAIDPAAEVNLDWVSSNLLKVYPDALWEFSTQYSVTISDDAQSLFGTGFDGDGDGNPGGTFTFSFQTTEPDNEPPRIVKGFPLGEGINTKAEMKFVFNEEVDGIIGRVSLLDSAEQSVSITDGKIINENDITYITFRPVKELGLGSNYFIELKAGISDFIGNELTSDTLFSFSTIEEEIESQNVIIDFSTEDDWQVPSENTLTAGINEVSFGTSSVKKISSPSAGLLSYQFIKGESGQVALASNVDITLQDTSDYAAVWIYGDLSNNELVFSFNDGYEFSYGLIDWFGWDYIKIPLGEIPGNEQTLSSIIIRNNSEGDLTGQLYFDDIQVSGVITDVRYAHGQIPSSFWLHQNYPNPFNPSTTIRYSIPVLDANFASATHVTLKVYDILGSEIATLVNETKAPGHYEVEFDASGKAGLTSGIYYYTLSVHGYSITKKMLLLK